MDSVNHMLRIVVGSLSLPDYVGKQFSKSTAMLPLRLIVLALLGRIESQNLQPAIIVRNNNNQISSEQVYFSLMNCEEDQSALIAKQQVMIEELERKVAKLESIVYNNTRSMYHNFSS